MKILFLLWIAIRGAFDASVWATAVWCLLYSFTNILWVQFFWIFLAFHFIENLFLARYVSTHTGRDCLSSIRLELISIGLSFLHTAIVAILPTVAAIVFLSFLQAWTNLETHWLHTCLFVTCVVYILLRGHEKRRIARQAKRSLSQRPGSLGKRRSYSEAGFEAKEVEQPLGEDWISYEEPTGKVRRSSAQQAEKNRRSARVIDV
jgi:hypothetical protein